MTRILIKGGRIVTAADDYFGDILIEDGHVQTISRTIDVENVETHDASGLLVLPGGVDVHTHMEASMRFASTVDTFESGTTSAAFGGTTTIIDYAKQDKGASAMAALENWHKRASGACIDVSAHMHLVDINERTLAEIRTISRDEGVLSFKMFMMRPGELLVEDDDIYRVMRVTKENGALACVHAENGRLVEALVKEALDRGDTDPRNHALTRPSLIEGEAAHRAIRIAELAKAPLYLAHVSTSDAVNSIAAARRAGIAIFAETCPHYLFLTEAEYERPGFDPAKYVMAPPLRSASHQEALWRALWTNDLQIVATDHCPFCVNERAWGLRYSKEVGRESFTRIPNGVPGVETRLSLIFDGGVRKRGFSINRFVELTSTAPARLFGLFPKKGTIAVGSDADIVLFDPNETWTIRASEQHTRSDYSMFEGMSVTGRVKKVFLRGMLIVDGKSWLGRKGSGQFQRRQVSGQP